VVRHLIGGGDHVCQQGFDITHRPTVIFFRTQSPIEPVSFVHAIMKDVATAGTPRTRYVKRLTPMTRMGRSTEDGLAAVAKDVLAPHFHADAEPKKVSRSVLISLLNDEWEG